MNARLEALADMCRGAVAHAPALAARLELAGLRPDDLSVPGALNRLPVLKKAQLLEQQEADPPFAGYLGCPISEVGYVFASPGPIFEPLLKDDETGHGMDRMFSVAGIGPGDIALNTWAYHLVPAGLLFDRGLRSCGATVLPSGPGNTELQIRMIRDMGVTAFLGSTGYFQSVAEAYFADAENGDGWSVTRAFLGGEFGEWAAKRAKLEADYGVKIWSCYATADLGLVGYEEAGQEGYTVHEDRLLQICDPETGLPLPHGETGEIVISTLSREWPMIRFGTGDLAHALALGDDGFVARFSALEGRIGEGVKVREIFVYPRHIRALSDIIPGVTEARACASRENNRETLRLEVRGTDEIPPLDEIVRIFRQLTRLKLDRVDITKEFTIPEILQDIKDMRKKGA